MSALKALKNLEICFILIVQEQHKIYVVPMTKTWFSQLQKNLRAFPGQIFNTRLTIKDMMRATTKLNRQTQMKPKARYF